MGCVLDREGRLLVMGLDDDADDDVIEHRRGTPDDVQVAVRHRVVAAGADRGDGMSRAHELSPFSTSTLS